MVAIFVGLFLNKNFKEDLEYKTIGGMAVLASFPLFLMGFRNLIFSMGWINYDFAILMFFLEYEAVFFLWLVYALPRLISLIFTQKIIKKFSFILGILSFSFISITFFLQREKIISYSLPYGLMFDLPSDIKFYFRISAVIFGLFFVYRVFSLFFLWRKRKILIFRFLAYLMLILGFLSSIPFYRSTLIPWHGVFASIGMLVGILGIYFFASQEMIEKSESI
jgi:hypothetical protein